MEQRSTRDVNKGCFFFYRGLFEWVNIYIANTAAVAVMLCLLKTRHHQRPYLDVFDPSHFDAITMLDERLLTLLISTL